MKRVFLVLLFFLWGAEAYATVPAFFGTVIHVAADDTLNVRARPDYRSHKLGAFPNGAHVYIDRCRQIGRSRWCHIHPDPLVDYGGAAGWVNAKFLRESNRGYVQIKGRKNNCYVSLKCRNEKCLVVTKLLGEEKVTGLRTEWIARSRLIGASNFSAQRKGEEGYCVSMNYIEAYLKTQRQNPQKHPHRDPSFATAMQMAQALTDKKLSAILPLIHPTKGIRLSEMVRFGGEDDKHFTRKSFETYWKNHRQINWGYTYGKGDLIRKDLRRYLSDLSIPPTSINQKSKLSKDLRGFPAQGFGALKGYSLRHTNPHSDTREYDWSGMVIILALHQGRWYVVGMFRDRWTI